MAPLLMVWHKVHHTKHSWVSFCHCISARVINEHCFNAHRPADFQNLSSGGPLLPFHIKHDSSSDTQQLSEVDVTSVADVNFKVM